MRRALATILTPAAIGLGGCGDQSADDLAQYLPEEVTVFATVDLDAAREELGLPEDADAIDIEAFAGGDLDIDSPEYQLINAAISEIADAGDGAWVMTAGDEGPAAGELVESPPGGPGELAELLADTDLPIGLATSVEEASDCLVAFGSSQNAAGTEGELIIEVDGEASADAVGSDALGDTDLDLGEPVIDGAVMTIPFTAPEVDNASPVGDLFARLFPLELYDCG